MDMSDLMASKSDPQWDDELSANVYLLPLPSGSEHDLHEAGLRLTVGIPESELGSIGPYVTAVSRNSHIACFKHAIDFLVPDGTRVVAMRGGKVVEVETTSARWGSSPKYRDYLNYITIEHTCDEFSQYSHLGNHSALVGCGDQVVSGQPIATVGKSGWTDRDHLHVAIYRVAATPFGFKSVRVQFAADDVSHNTVFPSSAV
jgi:murein DD-endopeptidase MepM/ murein hydrolase activator NlpD